MEEAARVLGIDFSIQLVRNNRGEIAAVFAGDAARAFDEAVEYSRKLNTVYIEEYADVVFISGGGYPRDLTLYGSQKVLINASKALKPGGVAVVIAELKEGVGNRNYHEMLKRPLDSIVTLKSHEIEVGIHNAYMTARSLTGRTFILYSEIDRAEAAEIHFLPTVTETSSGLTPSRPSLSKAFHFQRFAA